MPKAYETAPIGRNPVTGKAHRRHAAKKALARYK